MALFELKNVNLAFEENRKKLSVLEDINLAVDEGEFLCIVGPSGSGKSTILRVIRSFFRSGSITFFKASITFSRVISIVRKDT